MLWKKRLRELRAKRGQIADEIRSIIESSLEKSEFSAEQKSKLEELKKQERSLIEMIEETQEQIDREEELTKPADQPVRPEVEKQIGERAEDRTKGEPQTRAGRVDVTKPDPRDEKPFGSFGEQMRAIVRASTVGDEDSLEKLRRVDKVNAEQRAASGLNETVGADGGFLVQTDFSTELIRLAWETGQLASSCSELNVSSNSNKIVVPGIDEDSRATGSRFGGVRMYWSGEADNITATKPKFRKVEIELQKLVGAAYQTDEVIEDASLLGQILTTAFSEEIGFMVDDFIIAGTGVDQPLGILNSPALVEVTKEGSQSPDTFVFENAINMRSRLLSKSRSRGIWLMNQELETQLPKMNLAVGTGGSAVYIPAGGAAEVPYDRLFGMPIKITEQCSALGDKGDVLLVDLQYYALAKKGGPKTAVSVHVRFLQDEQVFRVTLRIGGKPLLSKAITPYKAAGGAKVSPFVTLQSR